MSELFKPTPSDPHCWHKSTCCSSGGQAVEDHYCCHCGNCKRLTFNFKDSGHGPFLMGPPLDEMVLMHTDGPVEPKRCVRKNGAVLQTS